MVDPSPPAYRLPHFVRGVVESFARVVCPPELGTLCSLDDVVSDFELHVGAMPQHLRAGLVLSFTAFDQGARLWPPARGRSFHELDPALAESYFTVFSHGALGPQRKVAQVMKGLVTLAYYEQSGVKASLAYHPERYIAEVAKRRLELHGPDIERGEAEVLAPGFALGARADRAGPAA
jgi:hypothetical protein